MSGAGVDPACAAWVRERITFLGAHTDLWNAEHDETVADFLSTSSQRRLLAWLDPILGLSLQTSLPQEAVGELHYFIKASGLTVTAENINDTLQYGVARGSAVGSLLRVMSGVFVPLCLSDQSWPDTIKKEFSGQMHKFMASLTETAWDAHGKTVLYIPLEDIGAPEVAAKQKHLVRVGLVPSAPGLSCAVVARAERTAAPLTTRPPRPAGPAAQLDAHPLDAPDQGGRQPSGRRRRRRRRGPAGGGELLVVAHDRPLRDPRAARAPWRRAHRPGARGRQVLVPQALPRALAHDPDGP